MSSTVDNNGRRQCLEQAIEKTCTDRNRTYGDPEDNFEKIAIFNSVIDKCKHPKAKVALQALAVKMARLVVSPNHLDSWLDIAGYGACGYDIALGMDKEAFQDGKPRDIVSDYREQVLENTKSSSLNVAYEGSEIVFSTRDSIVPNKCLCGDWPTGECDMNTEGRCYYNGGKKVDPS